MTQKSFNFARKFSLPLYFVSAADGTNVVKVTACRDWLVRRGRPSGEGTRSCEEKGRWRERVVTGILTPSGVLTIGEVTAWGEVGPLMVHGVRVI